MIVTVVISVLEIEDSGGSAGERRTDDGESGHSKGQQQYQWGWQQCTSDNASSKRSGESLAVGQLVGLDHLEHNASDGHRFEHRLADISSLST